MKYVKRITAALLCLVLLMGFASCAGGESDPKAAVVNTMDALKAGKLLTVKRNVLWDDMELLQKGMTKIDNAKDLMDALFNKLTYEVKGEPAIHDNTATLNISVTTKDVQKVLSGILLSTFLSSLTKKQALDDDFINEQIPKVIEQLNAADVKTGTRDVTVNLEKVKNKWKVKVDTTLENAILGGAASSVKYFIRLATGITTTRASETSSASTTAAKTGPATTLSPADVEKASRVQASMLAEFSKKMAQNTTKKG